MTFSAYLEESLDVLRDVAALEPALAAAADTIVTGLKAGGSLLVCGNGGSAADATHIAGELVGRYLKDRKAIRCINLASDPATLTAIANDMGYDQVFARQVEAYGGTGSVLLALSTSGNSPNILKAAEKAKSMNMKVVALTGAGGGKLAALTDHLLAVNSKFTPHIQQAHLVLYHYLCAELEIRLG